MNQTEGLKEYVAGKKYREPLGLPRQVTETYQMLAQGEYNRNYVFTHPATGKELVLRINFGSQMHLEHQIEYEYQALELLRESGRTPIPFYVDGSKEEIPYGVMVMEYLPGHAMNYRGELLRGADVLADIHSVWIPGNEFLISPQKPLRAILEECEEMFAVYETSPLGRKETKRKIRELMEIGWAKADQLTPPSYRCCINTELNSTNFLMNDSGKDYLIDWEKPLYGEPAQDLGHFLAPTTTFWKTDVILEQEEMKEFVRAYIQKVDGRFETADLWERTSLYIQITCLRGVTWCAMAWIQYQQPDKEIFNASTYEKLEAYLADDFLECIREFVE